LSTKDLTRSASPLCAPLPGAAQTIQVPYVSISGFQAPLYLGERAGLFKKNQLDAVKR
jgi:hypothetical protein